MIKALKRVMKTKEYWLSNLQIDLFNVISDYLKDNDKTQSEFADDLNYTKGYVSQILNGNFNHRIEKLVELSLAVGKAPVIKFENLDNAVNREIKFRESLLKSKNVKVSELDYKEDSNLDFESHKILSINSIDEIKVESNSIYSYVDSNSRHFVSN